MKNKINVLFERKKHNILSVFFTGGFPQLNDTGTIIRSLINNGVDMIEVGMPYSDPVADGPVIEKSDAVAISNGMTIRKLLQQLKELNYDGPVPLILMGYLNPVMQYGFEAFCRDAAASGVSGLILPDLPPVEFARELKDYTERYNLKFIFLITPETGEKRIRWLDDLSEGFIYAVSSSSITGRTTDSDLKEKYFSRISSYGLQNPVLVGFGIKDHITFQQACRYTNGAIVGTAFINRISENRNFEEVAKKFARDIRTG